jgi:hypothetical protein
VGAGVVVASGLAGVVAGVVVVGAVVLAGVGAVRVVVVDGVVALGGEKKTSAEMLDPRPLGGAVVPGGSTGPAQAAPVEAASSGTVRNQ